MAEQDELDRLSKALEKAEEDALRAVEFDYPQETITERTEIVGVRADRLAQELMKQWRTGKLRVVGEGWRDIASAPVERDEYSFSETFIGWSGHSGAFPCKRRNGYFFDLDLVDSDGDWDWAEPTHWMPFPTPPIQAATAGGEHEG